MKSKLVFYDYEMEQIENQFGAMNEGWDEADSKEALREKTNAVYIYKLVAIHKSKDKLVTEGVEVKYV